MKVVLKAALVFALMVTTLSLHHHSRHKHKQQNKITDVELLQTLYQKDLEYIKDQIYDLNKQLSKKGNDTQNTLIINPEIDAELMEEAYSSLPFEIKFCEEYNLTREDQQQLLTQAAQIMEKLQKLQKHVQQCSDCKNQKDLLKQLQQQKIYLKTIEGVIQSDCKEIRKQLPSQPVTGMVDLNQSYYKDNLKAPNWQYGNITAQQYRLKTFTDSIKLNLTSCPLDRPFVTDSRTRCFACPQKAVYSIGEKQCSECPDQTSWNPQKYACLPPQLPQQQSQDTYSYCPQDYLYDADKNSCYKKGNYISICPLDRPLWNSFNKYCEKCPVSTPIFDNDLRKCVLCPSHAPLFNRFRQKCQECPEHTPIYNSFHQKCQKCPKDVPVYKKDHHSCQKCPQNQPYFNTSMLLCQPCPIEQPYYSKGHRQCQACPINRPVYNPKMNKCYVYVERESSTQSEEKSTETPVIASEESQQQSNLGICPRETPHWNPEKRECQRCPVGHWSPHQQKCFTCTQEQIYIEQSNQCIQTHCQPGEKFSHISRHCEKIGCPLDRPYNNTQNNECEPCPHGTFYDSEKRLCRKQQNLNNCSSEKPYWNQITNLCERCSEGTKYDYDIHRCRRNCQINEIYSPHSKRCEELCPQGFIYDYHANKCQLLQQYYSCQKYQKYEEDLKQCVRKCSDKQTYDRKAEICRSAKAICKDGNHFNQKYQQCIPHCHSHEQYYFEYQQCLNKKEYCHKKEYKYSHHLNKCIPNCPQHQIYKVSEEKCVSRDQTCHDSEVYDTQYKKCVPQCIPGQRYNITSLQCQQHNPCQSPLIYDKQFQKCVKVCENGYRFNPYRHKCLKYCVHNQYWSYQTNQCQSNQCKETQYYSYQQVKCIDCGQNKVYNKEEQKCECQDGYKDQDDGSCIFRCQQSQFWNSQGKYCIHSDCAEGLHFDKQQLKCIKCYSDQQWEKNEEKCIPKRCPQENSFYDYKEEFCVFCTDGKIYDANLQACRAVCREQYIWNAEKLKCQKIDYNCTQGRIYIVDKKQCQFKKECDDKNEIYRKNNNTCEKVQYLTNPDSDNLITEKGIHAYRKEYHKQKQQNSLTMDCFEGTFYSKSLDSCVSCPQGHPYFNLDLDVCQNCGKLAYSHKEKLCITDGLNTDTKLQRLVMNIQ